MFRSKYAPDDVPTYVELTFIYQGKDYKMCIRDRLADSAAQPLGQFCFCFRQAVVAATD